MNNAQVYEKVSIKDFFSSLRDILVGNKFDDTEKDVEEKLKKIYEAQSETGATKNINSLEGFVQTYETTSKKTSKNKKISKGVAKQQSNVLENAKIIDENEVDLEK